DLIVDRAATVAKRNAAIHAARRLILGRFLGKRDREFLVMANPVGRRRIAPVAPVDFEKSGYLAHASRNSLMRRSPDGIRASKSGSGSMASQRLFSHSAAARLGCPPWRSVPRSHGDIRLASPYGISACTHPNDPECGGPAPTPPRRPSFRAAWGHP